jgi:hypothetical protein
MQAADDPVWLTQGDVGQVRFVMPFTKSSTGPPFALLAEMVSVYVPESWEVICADALRLH